MSTMHDSAMVEREYESLDRLAARRLDHSGWLRSDGEDEWEVALAAIAEMRPRRALEVGSGTADFAALIAAPEVVCVDSSRAAVGAARDRGLDAVLGDIRELPFADGTFDVVVCSHTLYHVADRDRGIAELARVLRAGGRFVGIYGMPEHLAEVWDAVGHRWPADNFDSETGGAELGRHFARVERRLTSGAVLWATRADLRTYLDAFSEMVGPLEAPAGPYPFVASRRKCVFVAETAA
jgi:SAM-dependent methyltransferase